MEKSFINADLSGLREARVSFEDANNNLNEITTEVNFISDILISLYFRCNEDF